MSQLVEVLYPLPDARRTPLSLLRWWESRRLFFNAVVGTAGLVTLGGVMMFGFLLPGGGPGLEGPPWQVVIAYAVLANICFSLGWSIEMVAKLVWGESAPKMGPLLFREGLIFSVGLTLLPLVPVSLFWMLRVLMMLFG